jgi:hypothetical protein
MNNTVTFGQFDDFVGKLLNQLECNEYSSSTLAGYKCALRKVRSFMEENGLCEYSHDTGRIFLATCLSESGYSDRWNKYIKTIIRRFDDYIQGSSCIEYSQKYVILSYWKN